MWYQNGEWVVEKEKAPGDWRSPKASRLSGVLEFPPGCGLRQSSAAFNALTHAKLLQISNKAGFFLTISAFPLPVFAFKLWNNMFKKKHLR
jgi:hypothetical protein